MKVGFCSILALAIALLVPAAAQGQAQAPLVIGVTPGGQIPLGPMSTTGEPLYTVGGGANLTIEYALPFAPVLYVQGLVGYALLPTIIKTNLNLVSLGAGAGVRLQLLPQLETQISVTGGYALGLYEGNAPGGAVFGLAEARLLFYPMSSFAIGLGASYGYYLNAYNGIGIFLGASLRPQLGATRSQLLFQGPALQNVFPVFYKYYDDHSLGTVTLENRENGTIRDIRVSFFVPQYMQAAKECAVIKEMAKGARQEVPLYALFKDDILRITEDTKVPAQIHATYTLLSSPLKTETTLTLRVHHRNAMTWDDNNKIASFVNTKDPLLLQWVKGIAGEIRKQGATAVNRQLREAMGVFDALRLYGVNYVVDPSSSFSVNSSDASLVDFLQFPVQTLLYRAGDCDDLSILYSALLEAIGIETAFITVPGHIFVAFNTETSAADASSEFQGSPNIILREGKAWVPVEITMVKDGFLRAWSEGAREWRDSSAQGSAGFFPVRKAWLTYEPVAGSDPGTTLDMPKLDATAKEYLAELALYVKQQVSGQAGELLAQIKNSHADPRLVNRLGLLYARYGLYDEAAEQFQKATAAGYVPAMVNMGNVFSRKNDPKAALTLYTQAAARDPRSVAAVEGMAKANYMLENMGTVKDLYLKLSELSPEEAKKNAYLVGGQEAATRAQEAGETGPTLWAE